MAIGKIKMTLQLKGNIFLLDKPVSTFNSSQLPFDLLDQNCSEDPLCTQKTNLKKSSKQARIITPQSKHYLKLKVSSKCNKVNKILLGDKQ